MPAATVKTTARQQYQQVQAKTKADDPGRYSKTPHEYGDILIRGNKLGTALQRDLVYWIQRRTWGDAKRPEWAKLSLSELAKLCDCVSENGATDRRSVARSLADLIARGIIEARDRKGCGPNTAKMYKLTPERWKDAPGYEKKAAEKAADTAELEEDQTDEAPAAAPEPESESTVAPGRAHRPQPVNVRIARNAPAVTIRVVYRNECDVPLTFRARTGSNGRVQVTAAPHKNGEGEAKECRVQTPHLETANAASKRLSEFDTAANRLTLAIWRKAADPALVASIVAAAGAAPVDLFEQIANARLGTREAARKHSSGLLIALARDAATTHAKEMAIAGASSPHSAPAAPAAAIPPEFAPGPVKPGNCQACNGTGRFGYWYQGAFEAHEAPSVNAGPCHECNGRGKARTC